MTAPALLLSAIASGQGKTSVTAALARHHLRRGHRVQLFKTGADFLDALMLERACAHPVHVLDLWMVGEEQCRRLLDEARRSADVVLIEGVMGLYDGTPCSADLARAFDLAVLAVIDVSAMAQTVGAVAAGLRDFGRVRLAGVIANRVAGEGHARMVSAALVGIPLVATLPQLPASLPERHLGLVLPGESDDVDAQLEALGRSLTLDERAWNAALTVAAERPTMAKAPAAASRIAPALHGLRIAVARDAAFAFLYAANVACLESLGARLSFFSPLAGDAVPAQAGAVFLPGGYPELHAERLSRAHGFHASIRAAHAAGVPILAECGGMMALAESMADTQGRQWPMAGILAGRTRMQSRLAALGLQGWNTGHGELRGHTFHYSIFETPLGAFARTVGYPGAAAGEPVYRVGALTASYFHAYFDSCPGAIAALLKGLDP
ncbi:MAG TPA: cobyrinate a,c-diamide synthase [Steroidobacteraceae bacterium]|nr:cobyrinate a,c-diamide synthase [Steroidobacteraceae bacterium]